MRFHHSFRNWVKNFRAAVRGVARRRLVSRCRPGCEPLEDRTVPVATTFVNDNWHFLADNDASNSLSVGDSIRNDNDTINSGTITRTYGIDAFGTVTTGAFPGTVAGAATINNAIAGTDVGGTVTVLVRRYAEKTQL